MNAPRAPLPRPAVALAAGLALLSLVGALGGALVRAGALPAAAVGPTGPQALTHHGALMMAGFFGALIALERVVALRRGRWVPMLAGAAGVALWAGAPPVAVAVAWSASALGLVGLYAQAVRDRTHTLPLPMAVEAAGALALLAGTMAWGFGAMPAARLGWSAFLVLTIAGERRELTQFVRLSAFARRSFIGWVAAVVLAVVTATVVPGAAVDRVWWAAMFVLALWLAAFDLAPRQRHAPGWAGHTAWCLSVGYGWLALAGALGLAGEAGAWHALWLGFVFAMVFGHAPIMLPALAGWRPAPTRWALLPLGVMGVSLAWRVSIGLTASVALGHIAALALFAAVMARAARRGAAQRGS